MRARSLGALCAALIAATACSTSDVPAPRPGVVEPARGPAGTRTPVVIRGEGFAARTVRSASGGDPTLDVTHRAWLGGTELEDVTWVDARTLHAVVPAGLPAGLQPLVVENPFGVRGRLEEAFDVVATPGAILSLALEPAATVASVGQGIPLRATVTNIGSAAAADVTSAVELTSADGGAVSLDGPTPALAPTLAPGEAFEFSFTAVALAAGTVALSGSARATDVFSGEDVGSPAASAEITIQLQAGLAATITASRATANPGQAVALTFTVTNGGSASAEVTSVTPTVAPDGAAACTEPSPSGAQVLASMESMAFTWTCTPSAAGSLTLSGTASGTDGNSGAPISATPSTPAALSVQTPAALSASIAVQGSPTVVSVGQPLTLELTVSNAGGASASLTAVTPSVTPVAAAACTAATPATPRPLTGGASTTFSWTCVPAVAGSLTFGAAVAGADGNTGAPLAATATPGATVTAQLPAAIVATVAASRAVATVGQAVTVSFTLANGGSATASISTLTPSSSGPSATCGAVSPSLPQAIASGQSRVFSWTCTPTSAGALALSGTATGTDGNSGAPISATPATPASVAVQTPPALSVTSFAATRVTANLGQAIGLTLVLANAGGATANVSAVSPTVSPASAGTCAAVSPAPPRALAGGASVTFTWSCTGSAAGAATLGATVAATDANTGSVGPVAVTGLPVTLQTPAAVSVAAFTATPATAAVGQPIALSLTLANGGGATGSTANVTAVVPAVVPADAATCTAPAPAPPAVLPGGATVTFTWSCTGSSPAALTLGASVTATDANTGSGVSPTVTALPVTIQAPAALAVTAFGPAATTVTTGQAVAVSLTLSNTGGNAAIVSSVSGVATPSASTSCSPASPAPPQTIPAGQSLTFSWSCSASATGIYTLRANIAAADASSGAPLTPTVNGVALTVIQPAALTAVLTTVGSPTVVSVGQPLTLSLTVGNTGAAAANLSAVIPSVQGTAVAGCTAASPAPPQTVAGGGSVTFGWTCTPTSPGTLTPSATVAGTDAVSGASLAAAPAAAPVTVQSEAALTASGPEVALVSDDALGDGSPSAILAGFEGSALVAARGAASGIVRHDPASAPERLALALGVDADATPAANAAWAASAPATTLGAPGCTPGSRACGPDDEAGLTTLAAGSLGGREHLLLAGVGGAGTRYVYAASSAAPGLLEASWLDLRDGFAGSAVPPLEAALFVPGTPERLFLGFAGAGRGPAVLEVLVLPATGGLDARAGAELLDRALPPAPGADLTALARAGGALYAASGAGLQRLDLDAAEPAGWSTATPVAAAWAGKVGSTAEDPVRANTRGVPALVAFGACGGGPCLYASRNVRGAAGQPALVPQLWRCAPSAGAGRCAPPDWALAAANAAGDPLLSQLGDPSNGAASLLVATPRWLYVGFDNAATGVQLYRTDRDATSIGEFQGRAGCAAGTPGCEGLGGNGLGDPGVTRVLDARALTVGGETALWVVAGDGVGPARLFRVEE